MVTAIMLLCIVAVSLSATVGVRDYLPSRSAPALLPVDSVIGKVVDVSTDPLIARSSEAFSQPWSAQWVSTYVEPSVRSMFTHTWDKALVKLLPASHVLGSAPTGDGSARTLAVRVFPSQGGPSSVYSLVWELSEEDGQWYLVAMNDMD